MQSFRSVFEMSKHINSSTNEAPPIEWIRSQSDDLLSTISFLSMYFRPVRVRMCQSPAHRICLHNLACADKFTGSYWGRRIPDNTSHRFQKKRTEADAFSEECRCCIEVQLCRTRLEEERQMSLSSGPKAFVWTDGLFKLRASSVKKVKDIIHIRVE